jgi:hypothetical protein
MEDQYLDTYHEDRNEIADHVPDPFHDAEAYSREEEKHKGWPGDLSGEDDLADYNTLEANDYLDE